MKRLCALLMAGLVVLTISACGRDYGKMEEKTSPPKEEAGASEVGQEIGERSVVKVAIYTNRQNLSKYVSIISKVNSESTGYVYEYEHYDESKIDRLIADISTDNAPDLLWFDYNLSSKESYLSTTSKYFDNLYSYIDNDSELPRESFIPNLLNALSVDGKLPEIWTQVSVITLSARTADLEDDKQLKSVGDYRRLFERSEYASWFSDFETSELLLSWASVLCTAAFTDKDNGTCSFDSEEFAELLTWIKEAGNDTTNGEVDPEEVFLEFKSVSRPFVESEREYFERAGQPIAYEPRTYVGFPVGEYGRSFYNCKGSSFAIPALGKNKEGAWDFVKSQLTVASQVEESLSALGLPVILEAVAHFEDAWIEGACKEVLQLFENTSVARSYTDEPLLEIINSSGAAFLAGDKSLEETVELIQNRASVYMAEKYG